MNLGFVVNNMGNSERNYELLKLIDKISDKNNDIAPYIFFQNVVPPVSQPNCLMMNILGITNFSGKVVAMDLESAQIVFNNNANTENWLFLWDLPWLYNVINYVACLDMLKNFKLVVRSEEHKSIVENYTGFNNIYLATDMDNLLTCLT